MSHIDVCLCLCVRYQWLIMVLMLGISSGYWLRHKPNPRGDDFLAPTANQLVYGDLFTYTRARMWLCARMHVCEFDNTHTHTKVHNVSKFNDGGLECLSPCSPQLISNAACLLISPQHWGSDATSVCTANHQHGLPELPTHRTGTFTPHERWERLQWIHTRNPQWRCCTSGADLKLPSCLFVSLHDYVICTSFIPIWVLYI